MKKPPPVREHRKAAKDCKLIITDRKGFCNMKKELCRPCAVELAAKGKTVKPAGGRSEKITCAQCGRRRFGVTYDVTGRLLRRKAVSP